MSITFNESTRIFTLNTAHSTYQMQADMHDYLLHLYYGARTAGEMDYLLSYADRGFSGNPYSAEMDRTYSLDALPQEYPSLGTGDFRNFALNIENADGSQCCDPVYVSHKITKGKYNLSGLPAVRRKGGGFPYLCLDLPVEFPMFLPHFPWHVLPEVRINCIFLL